jgi:ribosomal-protein-alanine N-acetyltransferase
VADVTVRWPVTLNSGLLSLRPLRLRDARAWREVRTRNLDWLQPWDATLPAPDPFVPSTYAGMVRLFNTEARAGRALPFGMFHDRDFIGQVTVGGITWGSLRGGNVGYWIDQAFAGRGLTPRAVAMAMDFCFAEMQLHRIEINIRPENTASLAVVRKLGLRDEGLRPRYLHINGEWRDHRSYAMTAEEVGDGVEARLAAAVPPRIRDNADDTPPR